MDAYIFSISFPAFCAGIAIAAISHYIIPRVAEQEESPRRQNLFIQQSFAIIVITSVVISAIFAIFFIPISTTILPKSSNILELKNLKYIMAFAWIASCMQVILSAISSFLNGQKKYVQAIALLSFPYFGLIAASLISHEILGIEKFLIGSLAVSILGIAQGMTWLKINLKINLKIFDFNLYNSNLFSNSLLIPFSMICFASWSIIDSFWAPRAGQSAIALLGYSQRIIISLGALIVAAPSLIMVNTLSAHKTSSRFDRFNKVTLKVLIVAGLFASLSMSCVYILFSIAIYFAADLKIDNIEQFVALFKVFRLMLPGAIAMIICVLMYRVIYCFKDAQKYLACVGILWPVMYFFLCWHFIQYGVLGMATAYSLAWIIFTIIIFLTYRYLLAQARVNTSLINRTTTTALSLTKTR